MQAYNRKTVGIFPTGIGVIPIPIYGLFPFLPIRIPKLELYSHSVPRGCL